MQRPTPGGDYERRVESSTKSAWRPDPNGYERFRVSNRWLRGLISLASGVLAWPSLSVVKRQHGDTA